MEPSTLVPLIIPTPPCRRLHTFRSERRALWFTFYFTHTFHGLSEPSCGPYPIRRLTHTQQPIWDLPRLLRDLIDNFMRAHYSLNYDTSLPEHKRCRPKGSIKVKPVTYIWPTSKTRTASWKWVQADAEFIVG